MYTRREKATFTWHLSFFSKDEYFTKWILYDRDYIHPQERKCSQTASRPINLIFPEYLSRIQCGVRLCGNYEELEDLLLVFRMSTFNE